MKSCRVAFITPEFPTELPDAGGLSNYLGRMTKALLDNGHHPEVFVISKYPNETLDWHGIIVHRVNPISHRTLFIQGMLFSAKLLRPIINLRSIVELLRGSLALATEFRQREKQYGFDLIQSSDYQAAGLFIVHKHSCCHVVRCSSASDLWAKVNNITSISRKIEARLELASIRRADAAYSPSYFLARYFCETHNICLRVIRPPVFMEVPLISKNIPIDLPKRFLLHFGQMMPLKGTTWLSQALPLAWKSAPDLTIVCAGKIYEKYCKSWEPSMGLNERRVVWLGALPKPVLYAVLSRAEAVVLPSLVDNLPNTVIESLLMGIPVIGTDGASINELVVHGQNGLLVKKGDLQSLADAMALVWNGVAPVKRGFQWFNGLSAADFEPSTAVNNLLALATK